MPQLGYGCTPSSGSLPTGMILWFYNPKFSSRTLETIHYLTSTEEQDDLQLINKTKSPLLTKTFLTLTHLHHFPPETNKQKPTPNKHPCITSALTRSFDLQTSPQPWGCPGLCSSAKATPGPPPPAPAARATASPARQGPGTGRHCSPGTHRSRSPCTPRPVLPAAIPPATAPQTPRQVAACRRALPSRRGARPFLRQALPLPSPRLTAWSRTPGPRSASPSRSAPWPPQRSPRIAASGGGTAPHVTHGGAGACAGRAAGRAPPSPWQPRGCGGPGCVVRRDSVEQPSTATLAWWRSVLSSEWQFPRCQKERKKTNHHWDVLVNSPVQNTINEKTLSRATVSSKGQPKVALLFVLSQVFCSSGTKVNKNSFPSQRWNFGLKSERNSPQHN